MLSAPCALSRLEAAVGVDLALEALQGGLTGGCSAGSRIDCVRPRLFDSKLRDQ